MTYRVATIPLLQDRVRRVPQRPRVLRHQPQDGRQLGQAARNGGNVSEAEAGLCRAQARVPCDLLHLAIA